MQSLAQMAPLCQSRALPAELGGIRRFLYQGIAVSARMDVSNAPYFRTHAFLDLGVGDAILSAVKVVPAARR